MKPEEGIYEPLVGYIVLEQCQAGVDMVGHRLVHIKRLDLKKAFTPPAFSWERGHLVRHFCGRDAHAPRGVNGYDLKAL